MVKRLTKWDKGFIQGYVAACANMMQEHGNSTEIEDCLKNVYKSIEELRIHEVEEYDINVLTPVINEIERKRALANVL